MRISLVEDDAALRTGLADVLRRAGYAVSLAGDGRQGLAKLLDRDCDLAIIDLGLPGIDGLDVIRMVRRRRRDLPIMVITARGGLHERIAGLDTGADDYLIKPFEIPEFEARVRALVRRQRVGHGEELCIGAIRFTPGIPRITAGDATLILPMGELAVLELLAAQPGHVVSREQIAARFARDGLSPSNAAIEVAIHRLRRKLGDLGARIRALRGFGYVMEELGAA